MADVPDTQQQELQDEHAHAPLSTKCTFAGLGGGFTALVFGAMGANALFDLALGGVVAYIVWSFSPELQAKTERFMPRVERLPLINRVDWRGVFGLGRDQIEEQITLVESTLATEPTTLVPPTTEQTDNPAVEDELLSEEAALFTVPDASNTGGVKRLSIEQIVRYVEPNSYRIFIGRSLTARGNPAVQINIYKQHFRIIGASQRGKSSWVAAFLDIVTRTHDRQHVLLALLDKENQTSNLFAHVPHIATLKLPSGETIRLHARNDEQVLEYLIHLMVILNQRYQLSKTEIVKLPIILIYVEEFLSLKNHFRAEMKKAKAMKPESKEAEASKAKAISDYETLFYCITEIAQRGLKVRMQLLLCAQVDYVDNDFREAQANISCGISLCVSPPAAEAAGFKNTDLLYRNYKDNQVGQGVVEVPGCNDLVLAPDFPVEERLIAWEQSQMEPVDLSQYRQASSEVATSAGGYGVVARNGSTSHPKWNEVATSPNAGVPTSEFGEVATSERPNAESDRNSSTGGTKWNRSGEPLRQLSERERRIGELFFGERKNPTAIVKEVFPDAKGGDAYQKAAAEVADAIRAYSEAMQTID